MTLTPCTTEQHEAVPYPGVREVLNQIVAAGHTRLVVVTERAARSLPPLMGLERPIEIWGSHGAERLFANGTYRTAFLSSNAYSGFKEAWAWLERAGHREQGERMPTGVTLHWRGLAADVAATLRAQAEPAWEEIARRCGLVLRPFDGGIELRAHSFDKGRPVRALLAEVGPGVAAAFLGDELTDEHAFAAMRGQGLTVLVRPEPRQTVAELWLRPPEELLTFLHCWHDAGKAALRHKT